MIWQPYSCVTHGAEDYLRSFSGLQGSSKNLLKNVHTNLAHSLLGSLSNKSLQSLVALERFIVLCISVPDRKVGAVFIILLLTRL